MNYTVLISEDDPDDQFLFKSALAELNRPVNIYNVLTGRQVIDFLLKNAVFSDPSQRITPDLIIATLKKPFFEFEIIKEIRIYSQFKTIPIYLFSMDVSLAIQQSALDAGANGFYKKPNSFYELKKNVNEILNSSQVIWPGQDGSQIR